MQLILGSRRYSSWSLRGWLAVRLAALPVEEVVVPLADGVTSALLTYSPTGLVPVLNLGKISVWDSLAIAEYCAEHAPALWPADRDSRAVARAIAAEMHAGFAALRREFPMSLGRVPQEKTPSEAAAADIRRIVEVWQDCLGAGGGFLFGEAPTIPDIMYAPVVTRFLTYQVKLPPRAAEYCERIRNWDLMTLWYQLAAAEPESWRLAKYE
jgi:glutathione S-transferase